MIADEMYIYNRYFPHTQDIYWYMYTIIKLSKWCYMIGKSEDTRNKITSIFAAH